MRINRINIVVALATVTLVMIVFNQYFWIKKDLAFQEKNIAIQRHIQEQSDELFTARVIVALTNVRDKLLAINNQPVDLYLDPVKQITKNYFVAGFYDTIPPRILRNLLIEEFEAYNISETFEYGIYDCFADSIIYDRYVDLSLQNEIISENNTESKLPAIKWKHDGHYFGVYFPHRTSPSIPQVDSYPRALLLSSLAILFAIIIMSYVTLTLLKQKKLSELKTNFINNMTHELKTPIATIKLSSKILQDSNIQCDMERISKYAKIIQTENLRLEQQVTKVLEVAKLEKDKIPLEKKQLSLHEIIRDAAETYRHTILDKNGYIALDLLAENDLIEGDQTHLTNIIYNLIDNAIKYCEKEPFITITTTNNDKCIILEIEDNGVGISKENIPYLFDRFYREESGDTHNTKGFGIGLYYVKNLIERHQGKISVKSTKGKGSTFTIHLPLSKELV